MTLQAAERAAAVTLGIDRLLTRDRHLVENRRVGLLCNPASINGRFRHSTDLIFEDPAVTLAAIFFGAVTPSSSATARITLGSGALR